MIHDIDAIYDHGVFHPLQRLAMPDGTHVHLRIEEKTHGMKATTTIAHIYSPRLAHSEQADDFEMEVREVRDAGV
jgi:predicted DNA-binding antitoxin AbrB/MazE fold protein